MFQHCDKMQENINNEATNMFNKIYANSTKVQTYCKNTNTGSRRVTDPEKKACTYITEGLQYIYSIGIDTKDMEGEGTNDDKERKAKENRDFKQTMMCLLLNAYADKLRENVASPCTVGEDTIVQAFNAGNTQMDTWCVYSKGQKDNCVKCERYGKYTECQISDKGNKTNVKTKLDKMLEQNDNMKKTLTTISSMNNLCQRSQCVITQWSRDKSTPGQRKWEKDSWKDIKDRINPLAKAMLQSDSSTDIYCTGTEEKKEACKQIVAGLLHIYGITVDNGEKTDKKENNRLFKQIMECLILNEYGKLLGEKCHTTAEAIQKAFTENNNLHFTKCEGDTCIQCNWDNCTGPAFDSTDLRKKIKGEIESNAEIQKALSSITNICQTKPATAAKPVAAKPAAYFGMLGKRRKRYKRAHQVRGPPLEEQPLDYVDQQDGPHEYTLVRERKQPRSAPTGRTKSRKKQGVSSRVGHRTIIDIHLEVIDECQKGDLYSTKEDFFEILVQEFMGNNSIKEKHVLNEQVPKEDFISEEDVPRDHVLKERVPKEGVQSSDSGFREEDFVPKEEILREGVPKEQVPSSNSAF
ncbi:SICA antigen [Plasmodium coatneyi]|uniref:SICA antigen n=1 Tax=Plasmodium coatneyi TaxID=208452 RepID=A0A1B1DXN5_9APIC|nr:SICA antigen [Plasmodium coatneyi]ANQ07571.1 SICA antigen [Plasmodium coatneyi]